MRAIWLPDLNFDIRLGELDHRELIHGRVCKKSLNTREFKRQLTQRVLLFNFFDSLQA